MIFDGTILIVLGCHKPHPGEITNFMDKCCVCPVYPTNSCSLNSVPLLRTSSNMWDAKVLKPGQLATVEYSSIQLLSHVPLFATPWITARQSSLSITNSQSSLRSTSIESVMPFSHLILCCPFIILAPIPPSVRVFSNESTLHMRWPKYWNFQL